MKEAIWLRGAVWLGLLFIAVMIFGCTSSNVKEQPLQAVTNTPLTTTPESAPIVSPDTNNVLTPEATVEKYLLAWNASTLEERITSTNTQRSYSNGYLKELLTEWLNYYDAMKRDFDSFAQESQKKCLVDKNNKCTYNLPTLKQMLDNTTIAYVTSYKIGSSEVSLQSAEVTAKYSVKENNTETEYLRTYILKKQGNTWKITDLKVEGQLRSETFSLELFRKENAESLTKVKEAYNALLLLPLVSSIRQYLIGESIQAGDFKWKVTKITKASEIGQKIGSGEYETFFGTKADGEFLILDVEVENTGNTAKYLMDSYVKLIDDKGREFSPDTSAALYLKPQGSAILFDTINPGITKKGKIVYDVPQGLTVVNLQIASNLLTDSFYTFKLIV